jgi:hypothetical protein
VAICVEAAMAKAARGVVLIVSAFVLAAGCTASDKQKATKTPEPLPTLQPGDYTATPSACALLSSKVVGPVMTEPHHDDDDDREKGAGSGRGFTRSCFWTDLASPRSLRLFDYVRLNVTRTVPDSFSNGLTAVAKAQDEYRVVAQGQDERAVPGMGDEASTSQRGNLRIVVVRKRNLVFSMACNRTNLSIPKAPRGYAKEAAQACLTITSQAFSRLH